MPTDEFLDDEPVFDRAYLRTLLSESRPDISLDEFKHYCNLPEDLMASLLAEVLNEGEAALYSDEWNTPIICLTPLGALRSGVHLSDNHPPEWIRDEDGIPPRIAAQEAGFILFADLQYHDEDAAEWIDLQPDPKQLESVEILVNIEEFCDELARKRLTEDHRIPKSREFVLHGHGIPWPIRHEGHASPLTPSASTWQEEFTHCPFCRRMQPGQTCNFCQGQAPKRRCPVCRDVEMGLTGYCAWCSRSGVDHILPNAGIVQARRKRPPMPKITP